MGQPWFHGFLSGMCKAKVFVVVPPHRHNSGSSTSAFRQNSRLLSKPLKSCFFVKHALGMLGAIKSQRCIKTTQCELLKPHCCSEELMKKMSRHKWLCHIGKLVQNSRHAVNKPGKQGYVDTNCTGYLFVEF
eukprot:jgi/Botrbrau1/19023/Bobra.0100s0053.1